MRGLEVCVMGLIELLYCGEVVDLCVDNLSSIYQYFNEHRDDACKRRCM